MKLQEFLTSCISNRMIFCRYFCTSHMILTYIELSISSTLLISFELSWNLTLLVRFLQRKALANSEKNSWKFRPNSLQWIWQNKPSCHRSCSFVRLVMCGILLTPLHKHPGFFWQMTSFILSNPYLTALTVLFCRIKYASSTPFTSQNTVAINFFSSLLNFELPDHKIKQLLWMIDTWYVKT